MYVTSFIFIIMLKIMSNSFFFYLLCHYISGVFVSQVPDEPELQEGDEEDQDKQLE